MARNAVIVAATVAVAELTPGVQPRRGVLAAVHCGRHARHAPASIGVRFRSCSNGRTATASSRVLPVSLRAYNRCRGKGRQRRRRWSDSTRAPPSRQLDASAPRETARSRDRARMPRQGDRPAPRQSVGAEHENVDPFQPVRPAGPGPPSMSSTSPIVSPAPNHTARAGPVACSVGRAAVASVQCGRSRVRELWWAPDRTRVPDRTDRGDEDPGTPWPAGHRAAEGASTTGRAARAG